MNFLKNKLVGDIAWTMSSLAILAASGIVINLIIAGFRDASALGAFNQSYAIYIISSQIAVFGLQYSVLRYAALYDSNAIERGNMLVNAATFALALGGCGQPDQQGDHRCLRSRLEAARVQDLRRETGQGLRVEATRSEP